MLLATLTRSHKTLSTRQKLNETAKIQSDSKILSGFPFIDHGNLYNILESLCILA
jgi:hypothetical protein